MNEKLFLLAMLVFGAAIGLTLSLNSQDDTQCKQLEENLQQNANFTGSIACFPPGTLGLNNSGVDNKTRGYCECRKVVNGNVQIFNIRVTD